jgi:adenine deaminase
LFIFDDLKSPRARNVYVAGKRYDRNTKPSGVRRDPQIPSYLRESCRARIDASKLSISLRSSKLRVIGARENQLITDHLILDASQANPSHDVLKMAVIERHTGNGNVGVGFIKGFGLKRGAIAGTVVHDHHNLVVIGCDDESMLHAARAACGMGGGLVAVDGSQILAKLALPVAGLMSDRPIDQVRAAYDQLLAAAKSLGSTLHDPFMAMSFMALEVIPSLKLTDKGLVDVEQFQIVDLFV